MKKMCEYYEMFSSYKRSYITDVLDGKKGTIIYGSLNFE